MGIRLANFVGGQLLSDRAYQQGTLVGRIVHPDDLSRVNVAFFTLNGVISIVFLAAVLADVLV